MPWHFAFQYTGGSPRWRAVKSRLFGIGFVLMGCLHLAAGGATLVADWRRPPPDRSPWVGLLFVGAGLLSAGVGHWLCTRIPFRPDLGDIDPILGKAGGYNAEYIAERKRMKRTWWTGDPLPIEQHDHDA